MAYLIYDGHRNEFYTKAYATIEEASQAFVDDLSVPDCNTCSNRIHCLVDPDCIHIEGYIWELPDMIELSVSPAWFGGIGSIDEVFDKIPGSRTWNWTPEGFKLNE